MVTRFEFQFHPKSSLICTSFGVGRVNNSKVRLCEHAYHSLSIALYTCFEHLRWTSAEIDERPVARYIWHHSDLKSTTSPYFIHTDNKHHKHSIFKVSVCLQNSVYFSHLQIARKYRSRQTGRETNTKESRGVVKSVVELSSFLLFRPCGLIECCSGPVNFTLE